MKKEEKITKNKNFLNGLLNAINGVNHTIKSQINIKIQLVIAVITIIMAVVFKLNKIEWICLCFAIFFVIVTETINTAIESAVDLCTTEYHPKAKIAKDVGAGAVLIAAINAVFVGGFLFWDKIMQYF